MMTKNNVRFLEITYRKMLEKDIDSTFNLESTVLDGQSLSTIKTAVNSDINSCFVAISGEELCGFCSFTCAGGTANLDSLSVHENFRRCGIGKELLQYAMKEIAKTNTSTFWLEVRSENITAVKLYENLGFYKNGFRKNFYKNPSDDAILMEFCFK